MKIEPLYLDIAPAYISFEFQASTGDGTAIDPTGTPTLAIYEESGADATYDNSQVTGSPFNLAKINSLTGNCGVLVDKALFTAGKLYRCIYSATVDGIATKKVELLQACNASQFKADVSVLSSKVGDLHDEAFGKWVLDPSGKTLTLYKADGVTVLKAFNLGDTTSAVPLFISRTPA